MALNSSTGGAWGLDGLTMYVTAFHLAVLQAVNTTTGFHLSNCRLLVNSFFASNGPGSNTRGRWANWTMKEPGPLLDMRGSYWAVTGCDLYSGGDVITSMSQGCNHKDWPSYCHGSAYGYVAGSS